MSAEEKKLIIYILSGTTFLLACLVISIACYKTPRQDIEDDSEDENEDENQEIRNVVNIDYEEPSSFSMNNLNRDNNDIIQDITRGERAIRPRPANIQQLIQNYRNKYPVPNNSTNNNNNSDNHIMMTFTPEYLDSQEETEI